MEFEFSGTPFLSNLFRRTPQANASDSNLAAASSDSSTSISEYPQWYQRLRNEGNRVVPTLMKDFKGNDEALHSLAEAIFDMGLSISDTNRRLLIAASERWLRGDGRFPCQIESSLRNANERPITRRGRGRLPHQSAPARSRSADDTPQVPAGPPNPPPPLAPVPQPPGPSAPPDAPSRPRGSLNQARVSLQRQFSQGSVVDEDEYRTVRSQSRHPAVMHPTAKKKLMASQHFAVPPGISDPNLALLYNPFTEDGVGLSRNLTHPNVVEISRQYLKERRDMLKGMAYYFWQMWNKGNHHLTSMENMAQYIPPVPEYAQKPQWQDVLDLDVYPLEVCAFLEELDFWDHLIISMMTTLLSFVCLVPPSSSMYLPEREQYLYLRETDFLVETSSSSESEWESPEALREHQRRRLVKTGKKKRPQKPALFSGRGVPGHSTRMGFQAFAALRGYRSNQVRMAGDHTYWRSEILARNLELQAEAAGQRDEQVDEYLKRIGAQANNLGQGNANLDPVVINSTLISNPGQGKPLHCSFCSSKQHEVKDCLDKIRFEINSNRALGNLLNPPAPPQRILPVHTRTPFPQAPAAPAPRPVSGISSIPHAPPAAPPPAPAPPDDAAPVIPVAPPVGAAVPSVPVPGRSGLPPVSSKDMERSLPKLEENPTQKKALEFAEAYKFLTEREDVKDLEQQLKQAVANRLQDSSKSWFMKWCAVNPMSNFLEAFRARFLNSTRMTAVSDQCNLITRKQGESTMEYGRRLQSETEPLLSLLKCPEDRQQSNKLVVEHFVRQLPGWFQKIIRPDASENVWFEEILTRTKAEVELSGDPVPAVKSVSFGSVETVPQTAAILSAVPDLTRPAVGHTKNYGRGRGRNNNSKYRQKSPNRDSTPPPAPPTPQLMAVAVPPPQAQSFQDSRPRQSSPGGQQQYNPGSRPSSPHPNEHDGPLRRSPRDHPGSWQPRPQAPRNPSAPRAQVLNPGMGVADLGSNQPGVYDFGGSGTTPAPRAPPTGMQGDATYRLTPCFRCNNFGHWRSECPNQWAVCNVCGGPHTDEEHGKKIPAPKPMRNPAYQMPQGSQVASYPSTPYYGGTPSRSNAPSGNGNSPSRNMNHRR